MKSLLIDCGNSAVKFSLASLKNYESPNTLPFETFISFLEEDEIKFDTVILSSVLSHKNEDILINVLNRKTTNIFRPKNIIKDLLTIRYSDSIGEDRLVTAFAAADLYSGQSSIIVDMGTAVTVDLVLDGKIFEGGYIFSGLMTDLKNISHRTGKLPNLELIQCENEVPQDTESALFEGTLYSKVFGINGLIGLLKKKCKTSIPKLIFCGNEVLIYQKYQKHYSDQSPIYRPSLAIDGLFSLLPHVG